MYIHALILCINILESYLNPSWPQNRINSYHNMFILLYSVETWYLMLRKS